jgi:hypothetical protein
MRAVRCGFACVVVISSRHSRERTRWSESVGDPEFVSPEPGVGSGLDAGSTSSGACGSGLRRSPVCLAASCALRVHWCSATRATASLRSCLGRSLQQRLRRCCWTRRADSRVVVHVHVAAGRLRRRCGCRRRCCRDGRRQAPCWTAGRGCPPPCASLRVAAAICVCRCRQRGGCFDCECRWCHC